MTTATAHQLTATAEAPDKGVGRDALFGASYVAENLRSWAADFREQQHPATLTLFRAAQVLEKLDAEVTRLNVEADNLVLNHGRKVATLEAEIDKLQRQSSQDIQDIAMYRVAIDDFCEAWDEGLGGDSKFVERLRAALAPRSPKSTPVWQKYGHPSEVSISLNK